MTWRAGVIKSIGVGYRSSVKCQQQRHPLLFRRHSSVSTKKNYKENTLVDFIHQKKRIPTLRVATFAVATKIDQVMLCSAELGMPIGWDAGVMEGDDDGG